MLRGGGGGTFSDSSGAMQLRLRSNARAFTGIALCFDNPVESESGFDSANPLLQVSVSEQPRTVFGQSAHDHRGEVLCKTAGASLVSEEIAEQYHRQLTASLKNSGRPDGDQNTIVWVDTRPVSPHLIIRHTGIDDGLRFDQLRLAIAVRKQRFQQIGGNSCVRCGFLEYCFGNTDHATGFEAAQAIATPELQMDLTVRVQNPNLQKIAIQKRIVSDVHLRTFLDRIEGVTTHLLPGASFRPRTIMTRSERAWRVQKSKKCSSRIKLCSFLLKTLQFGPGQVPAYFLVGLVEVVISIRNSSPCER